MFKFSNSQVSFFGVGPFCQRSYLFLFFLFSVTLPRTYAGRSALTRGKLSLFLVWVPFSLFIGGCMFQSFCSLLLGSPIFGLNVFIIVWYLVY